MKPYQQQIGQFILNAEARRDKQGRLAIYKLPPADGGGTYEVAGINDRYHPGMAAHLREIIAAKQYDLAERAAAEYLIHYTDVVTKWTKVPSLEAFLRDTTFNRGAKGALRILQLALRVADDGKYGPQTKAALAAAKPAALLTALRRARETYEIRIAPPVGARAKFWKGLQARWDNALKFSQTLQ